MTVQTMVGEFSLTVFRDTIKKVCIWLFGAAILILKTFFDKGDGAPDFVWTAC